MTKKYPTMQDWINSGIIEVDFYKKERQHKLLHDMLLPCLNVRYVDGSMYGTDEFRQKICEFLEKRKPTVLISSPKILKGYTKKWIDNCCKWEQVKQFMDSIPEPDKYFILITEMVQGTEDTYVGIAIHKDNKLLFEFYKRPFWTDIRAISSGCGEAEYLRTAYIKEGKLKIQPKDIPFKDIQEIYNQLQGKTGYFEFIKGVKSGISGIYFMEFQDDSAFSKAIDLADNLCDR
jgi:hypothetical protein